jgi:putrescine aminotransferase
VAIENLNIMRREKIVERVREEIAPYFQKRIRELADHRLVGEVRGLGMLGAIELVADRRSRTFFRDRGTVGLVCRDHCFKNGLIMRAVRDTMIMAPPLVMTKEDVDELMEKARRCLDLTARDIGVG